MKLNAYGKTYNVRVQKGKYDCNQNLGISLFENNEEYYPFAVLTINTDTLLPENQALVDINNCEWAEDFIKENKLGKPIGQSIRSGYVYYPIYEFDLSKLG